MSTSIPADVFPRIPLTGTSNFRDFGGRLTQSGRRVKRASLFRSGHLAALTDSDLVLLANLDIRLVFDFRHPAECQREPSQFPSKRKPRVVNLPIDPGKSLDINVLDGAQYTDVSVEDVVDFMCRVNRELVLDYSHQYRTMFDTLLNAPVGATLIHCSAGKDRTGFAAAMILGALDVAMDHILDDYLLSALYFDIERELALICQRLNWRHDQQIIRPVLEVREEYLQTAFAAITEKYPQLDDYLTEELGVDSAARDELRARYLED